MTTVNTYLTFNGNCEEAFNFYKTSFGGEFTVLSKFNEMPEDPNVKLNEADLDKVMHITLPIGNTILMGSDVGGEWADNYTFGNNFSISINTDSVTEADRLFEELSIGGQVMMLMNETFWGSYFGMLTDKYGIQWMISFDTTK